jgi:acyl-coenzyme A synthetase/AMP-(fatty) acid ligase
VRDALPRNATGKIMRRALAAELASSDSGAKPG